MAADPKIVIYIRDSLSKGYSLEVIRKSLIDKGWDTGAVEEALKSFDEAAAPPVKEAAVQQPKRGVKPILEKVELKKVEAAKPKEVTAAKPEKPKEGKPLSRNTTVKVVSLAGIILSLVVIVGGLLDLYLVSYPLSVGESDVAYDLDFISYVPVIFGLLGVFLFLSIMFNVQKLMWVVIFALGITATYVGYLQTNIYMAGTWLVVIVILLLNRNLLSK